MLTLTLGALVAGVLTTLAPCVLPLLPVIVGGSVAPTETPVVLGDRQRALVIAGSPALSVMLFTLALRASTALIDIPPQTWAVISGSLLFVLVGLAVLTGTFPDCDHSITRRVIRSVRRLPRPTGGTNPMIAGGSMKSLDTRATAMISFTAVGVASVSSRPARTTCGWPP